eukprot:2071493-Prymnesium_polylepis.1
MSYTWRQAREGNAPTRRARRRCRCLPAGAQTTARRGSPWRASRGPPTPLSSGGSPSPPRPPLARSST